MKIIECEQGSKVWLNHRLCKVTGTDLDDVMGSPLLRLQLISKKIAEEATEQGKVLKATPEMERGTAEEPFAAKAFEVMTGKKIKHVGFCVSDEFSWLGYSPDGLIEEKGRKTAKGEHIYSEEIEIKNPDSHNVIFTKLANMIPVEETGIPKGKQTFLGVPIDYKWQVVAGFLINEKREKLHFCIYDARFIADDQKMYVVEVERSSPLLQEAMEEARVALVKFREDWMKWKEIVLPINF